MDTEALRLLAEHRAQSDTKSLKKAIKEFYTLLRPEIQGEQLEAYHSAFNIGLDQLNHHLSKSTKIETVTRDEVESYRDEQRTIDESCRETESKIKRLHQQLVEAQLERAQRIEYDGLTKVINRLPDREKGIESQKKLQADIDLLRQEERTYAETWQTRKLTFDRIVESLEVMQEAIRDEKAEQERRRALDEEEDEDAANDSEEAVQVAASLDPNAKVFVPGGRGGGGNGSNGVEQKGKEGEEEGTRTEGGEGEDEEMKEVEEERRDEETSAERIEEEEVGISREEGEMDTQ